MQISFPASFTQCICTWEEWKAHQFRYPVYRFEDNGSTYTIWGYDGPEIYICVLDYAEDITDKVDFDTHYKAGANGQLDIKTLDGRQRAATEKSDGSRANFYSHDWTDPTTWYQQAARTVTETAAPDGSDNTHKTYFLSHAPIIDTYHGKITQEDFLKDASGYSFRAIVTVNGTPKIEQDPHFGTGGDYTVDYAAGKIMFLSALDPVNDIVTVTYHWVDVATGNGVASRFTIAPVTGKKLVLTLAECQFSTDVNLKDTVIFEVWGIADYFLSTAQMISYGILPGIGYKVKLQTFVYKTLSDFQNDAMRAYPRYPDMGDPTNWRSQKVAVTVFDWDYIAGSYIQSSKGMEVRLYLQHDRAFDGWMATTTFYMISEDE